MQPRHFLYWLPSKDIVSPQVKEYLRALSPCGALVSLRQVFNFSLQPFAFGGHIKQALRGARFRLPGKAYNILFRSICQAPGYKKLFRLVLSCASSRRLCCPRSLRRSPPLCPIWARCRPAAAPRRGIDRGAGKGKGRSDRAGQTVRRCGCRCSSWTRCRRSGRGRCASSSAAGRANKERRPAPLIGAARL